MVNRKVGAKATKVESPQFQGNCVCAYTWRMGSLISAMVRPAFDNRIRKAAGIVGAI